MRTLLCLLFLGTAHLLLAQSSLFTGKIHYEHQLEFDSEKAEQSYRKMIGEMKADSKIDLGLTLRSYGRQPHRRTYLIAGDDLLGKITTPEGDQVLEYRIQEGEVAYRASEESGLVTKPVSVVENRYRQRKRGTILGQEVVDGLLCEKIRFKFYKGEVTYWVTDEISLPANTHTADLLLDGKFIVKSEEYDRGRGTREIFRLTGLKEMPDLDLDSRLTDIKARFDQWTSDVAHLRPEGE